MSRGLPQTQMGWEIDADGLYDLLVRVARDYPGVPLYVTENGAAFPDEKDADGAVARRRTASPTWTRTSRAAHRAIADGVDLRGYFVVVADGQLRVGARLRASASASSTSTTTTLQRTPKDSARWYAQITKANGLA